MQKENKSTQNKNIMRINISEVKYLVLIIVLGLGVYLIGEVIGEYTPSDNSLASNVHNILDFQYTDQQKEQFKTNFIDSCVAENSTETYCNCIYDYFIENIGFNDFFIIFLLGWHFFCFKRKYLMKYVLFH